MSIVARIHAAKVNPDNTVKIYLSPIGKREIAGQRSLTIINWPEGADTSGLIGVGIWGGSREIMVGGTKWADRIGYTKIQLV